ncbi:hypothetical protein HJC23_011799 [Cyclotella cryptica]|uniref:Uso1/p115-like vesicle tethering protein C-terminal domain-containing protein n=1 Tax=Cyclotella cryptica TaxID=29204 RepID=A0ABD3PJW8_9STRA|eukprot:CCRYP_014347-RA/>CCRYP_014347-RA protein AED:0.42 eAED:0.42 QI:49/1/1/1/1/1/4/344/225
MHYMPCSNRKASMGVKHEDFDSTIRSTIDPVQWKNELERVSSRLIVHHTQNEDDWRCRLDQNISDLRSLGDQFSKMEHQISQIGKLILDDLQQIDSKEVQLHQKFNCEVNEYEVAKTRLMSLEKSIDTHTSKTAILSEKLGKLSADVDAVKKEIDKKGSSITDTSPVVEIRAALQLLKEENKELDVRLGILDYEVTKAMMHDAKREEKHPLQGMHSDDDDSSLDE